MVTKFDWELKCIRTGNTQNVLQSAIFLDYSKGIQCQITGGRSTGGFWRRWGKEALSLLKASKRSIDYTMKIQLRSKVKSEIMQASNNSSTLPYQLLNEKNQKIFNCITFKITTKNKTHMLISPFGSQFFHYFQRSNLLSVFPSKSGGEK